MLLTLAGLLFIAVLILLANAATESGISHGFLRILPAAMPAVVALQLLGRVSNSGTTNFIQCLYLGFAAASIAIMLLLIRFDAPWPYVKRLISGSGLVAAPTFDSRRPIHRLAFLLLIFGFSLLFWTASAEGLQQDLLNAYSSAESALDDTSMMAAAYVLLALWGVGWLVRRDWASACKRLGLRFPTTVDVLIGCALGCALYLGVSLMTMVWQSMAPASDFQWQTAAARQLFASMSSSLLLGALVALLAAIGEETLFRGALQPVFGVPITSLFFTAIHLQYVATPAMAIVFVVSLAFGLARAWLSTTAAIIAHVIYNLIPFLLANLA